MISRSIIIIDDETDLVNLFKEALEINGFDVTAFIDSIEALEHVRRNHKKYSLIISDFRMPKIDGFELCTELLNYNPNLKVILMSGYENLTYDRSRFIFLSKPILIARLVQVVNQILDGKIQTKQQSNTVSNLDRKYHTLYNIK